MPSIVEFLEVKDEVDEVEDKTLEKSLPSVVEFLEVKDQLDELEVKEEVEDIEVELVKPENEEEVKEPLQSSTLVEEIFQKFQNKPEEKAEVKTEPKKTYNRFWTYLGWK